MESQTCALEELCLLSSALDVSQRTHLPQEVTDMIIDHLHEDRASLETCTVVSHSWLWSARYHLFYNVIVTTSADEYNMDLFLKTLSSSLLKLGDQVRCLHIRGARDTASDSFTSVLSFIHAVLPKLPSIQSVNLCGMVWGQIGPVPVLVDEQPIPRELGKLSLKDIRLEASDAQSLAIAQRHLFYLFRLFTNIRQLSIDTVRIGYRSLYRVSNGDVQPDTEVQGDCCIQAVNCCTEDDSFYLLAALSKFGIARNLQTLKFGSGCPEITASAQVIANLAASSLRFVRYRVPSDDYVASRIPVLDLSQCHGLHTVHLRGFVSSSTEARTILDQMAVTLARIPADTLAVILEFFARPGDFELLYETVGQERWPLLDQLLSERSEMRRVAVVLRSTSTSATPSLTRLEDMLPLSHRRSKLRCFFNDVEDTVQWHKLVV